MTAEKFLTELADKLEETADVADTAKDYHTARNLRDAAKVLRRKQNRTGGCETCRHGFMSNTSGEHCPKCHRCLTCGTRSEYEGYDDE